MLKIMPAQKFAKHSVQETGYQPTCLNVDIVTTGAPVVFFVLCKEFCSAVFSGTQLDTELLSTKSSYAQLYA